MRKEYNPNKPNDPNDPDDTKRQSLMAKIGVVFFVLVIISGLFVQGTLAIIFGILSAYFFYSGSINKNAPF